MTMTKRVQPTDSIDHMENATAAQVASRVTDLGELGFLVISVEEFVTHTAVGDVEITKIYYRKVDAV